MQDFMMLIGTNYIYTLIHSTEKKMMDLFLTEYFNSIAFSSTQAYLSTLDVGNMLCFRALIFVE